MKNIVVITGAGISAESGLKTFRDSDGLWNNHRVTDVATPEAWLANKELVLDFYNHRRTELGKVVPNDAHFALCKLEAKFKVNIVTQNVDDLHERGGSSSVLHLHGELTKVRGEYSDYPVLDVGYDCICIGDQDVNGEQLRPHIVWFGEDVPRIMDASRICEKANILLIIGTSLNVYPAAGLVTEVSKRCEIYLIDPKANEIGVMGNVNIIKEKAGTAVPALVDFLLKERS